MTATIGGVAFALILPFCCYLFPALVEVPIGVQLFLGVVAGTIAGITCIGLVVALSRVETEAPWLRHLTIAAIIGGLLLLFAAVLFRGVLFAREPTIPVLSFVVAIIPAIFFSSLVVMLDHHEREPSWMLVVTFLWGASVSIALAGAFNTTFQLIVRGVGGAQLASVLTPAIAAPITEEVTKGAALLVIFFLLRREFDNVLDGVVYGAIVGLGFAMAENIQYFTRAYEQGQAGGFITNVYIRVILGGFGHAAYTATFGAALGYARETRSVPLKIGVPVFGLGLAIFQHFAWNFIAATLLGGLFSAASPLVNLFILSPIRALIFKGPALATLFAIAYLTSRREAKIIAEQLRAERQAGVLTEEEYVRLSSARKRLAAEWSAFKRTGVRGWYRLLTFHHTATELAFKKWHLSRGEQPKGHQRAWSETDYHTRIAALRSPIKVAPIGVAAAV